jgi:hypothetical protein
MIYVDTYNDLMFHEKENCCSNLEGSFVDNEFWNTLADNQELTKNIILEYIFGGLCSNNEVNQMTDLYDTALDDFLGQYMQVIDEKQAEDYEAGDCDWGD